MPPHTPPTLGTHLSHTTAPAAVIDIAIVKRNCAAMLATARALGVQFRAHVKTHKTTELTRLQVGASSRDIRLVVSTVTEAEGLLPYLLECKRQGKSISLIYGLPLPPSKLARLGDLATRLGPDCISVLVDHPEQLDMLCELRDSDWPGAIPVFVKIDTGYGRAGIAPGSPQLASLFDRMEAGAGRGRTYLAGFYSHMGSSYGGGAPATALAFLREEIEGL
ncbi:hypothetical protein LTR28_009091, partial [Elasticomyces elasticus]